MAWLSCSKLALRDLEKLTGLLIETDPLATIQTTELIEEAISVLKRHPLIGRRANLNQRELVISRGKTGYVALYTVEIKHDAVLIVSIRHQPEAGYVDA